MANKESTNTKVVNKPKSPTVEKNDKNHFVNPTETWWGKAIIWALVIAMVGGLVIGLIAAIINGGA